MREKGFPPIFVSEASKWQICFLVRYRVYDHLSTTNISHFSYNFQKTQCVGFRKEMLSRATKKDHNSLLLAAPSSLWLRHSVWCFPGHKTYSSLQEVVLHVKWHNILVPEHYGKSYQWEKTIVKLFKQMSFLGDILLPASILFPVMHTQT